jgi:hypothetical protein
MNTKDKINQDFLTQYSAVFADKLFQTAYESKTHLTGKDILNLSSIKQLNLFVIKAFFTEWQSEVKKLESPLFDYSAREVRKSMIDFMNILSQHIFIAKQDLKPYVDRALSETILLTRDPLAFLEEELSEKKSNRVTSKLIKSQLKYIVFHKDLLLDFFTSVEGESVREALAKAEIYFDDLETDVFLDELIQDLSAYLVLDKEELLVPSFHQVQERLEEPIEEEAIEMQEEERLQREELAATSSDYFGEHIQTEADEHEDVEEDVEDQEYDSSSESHGFDAADELHEEDPEYVEDEVDAEEEVDADEELDEMDEFTEAEDPNVGISNEEDEYAHEEVSSLAQKEVEEEHSVNQKFEEEHKTLAELHEDKKIESVFEAISINHRYMFLQELFDGDNEVFNEALKSVDDCGTFDEAVEMLVQNYAKDFFWDMNSDEVKELLKVVYRKFRA